MSTISDERSASLRQHEEPFLTTFELVGFGVGHLALDGKWTMVSQRLCEIVGHSRHHLLGNSMQDIGPPEDAETLLEPRLLAGQMQTHAIEKQVVRGDGRNVWVKIVVAPIRDEDTREPRYLFAVVEDVTAQKEAQHALTRQAEFDELMTRILTVFTVCSAAEVDDRVTDALRQLAELVGVDHAHAIIFTADRSTWSATHEWCGAGVTPQIDGYRDIPFGTFPWSERKVLAGETIRINSLEEYPAEASPELHAPDVQVGSLSLLRVPIRGAAGVIAGCVGLDSHARPITWSDSDVSHCKMVGDAITSVLERKRAEEALRESEERFRAMADSAPILMWMSGADKACTGFNRGWLEFTGRTMEQELGDGWAVGVHPEDLQKCLQVYVTSFDARQPFKMEYRLRRHDGEYRWIQDTGAPRFLPDGSFAGYIGCCVDIHDRRELEITRRDLAGRLMTAQEEERGRIARELHDDIGQSLALLGIQMQRASQAASADPEKRIDLHELRDKVKEISSKITRLSHRLHSSELEYLGLAIAVKSLCREFSRNSNVAIECECDPLPASLKDDVSVAFLRIIQEALHNVAKHSQAQLVRVRLAWVGQELTLSVSDDGVGFDANRGPRKPGLGLISMRERMLMMGGELEISSQPGCGTQIRVRAPLPIAARRASV
jgi:PAS domain S-box-containing protein